MNMSLNRAVKALIFASMVLGAAIVLNLGTSGTLPVTAAKPAALPQETWQPAVDISSVSGAHWYDNSPAIGASPLNDGVTIAWEQRDESNAHSFGAIVHNSNPSLGQTNFLGVDELSSAAWKANGSPRVAHDSLGRRHVIWWQQDGNGTCGWYGRVDADGIARNIGIVPSSCSGRKNTALGVGVDNTVHAFFGTNLANIYYYQMDPSGNWVVQSELVNANTFPKDLTADVTTNNVVMVAWVGNDDLQVSTRNVGGGWSAPVNLTSNICGTPHLPDLARDNNGGMHIVWSEVDCNNPNSFDEVYYTEWTAGGGWVLPPRNISHNSGNSYRAVIAVDGTGKNHIAWQDDTGHATSDFRLYYTSGQGFNIPDGTQIFTTFGGGYQKEASLDAGLSAVHITFGANRDDGQKDNYYSYALTTAQNTSTPTLSPTPTITPTPCSQGNFSDVFPTDYYYEAVRNLSFQNIMSGYSDCTFRPSNNLTRGQTAKIVVIGANVPLYTPTVPTFRDVPVGSTFYTHIESAYHAGVISGYSCGTGCLEFRPGANVTRGQYTKMIQLAFEFTIFTPPTPTFRDVPANHIFYRFIETVYHLGIISGYSCGTGCLEFRPDNNITRGQAAKVLWNAINVQGASPTPTVFFITATPTHTPLVVTNTPVNTPTVTGTPPSN